MALLNIRSTVFVSVLAALAVQNAESFSPSPAMIRSTTATRTMTTTSRLLAADDDDKKLDGAQITSARKELKFDEKSGRFFETNLDEEECIPDEEFCTIDEDTGSRIRLTVAEKERIFLDALQVRTTSWKGLLYIQYATWMAMTGISFDFDFRSSMTCIIIIFSCCCFPNT